jgi:hypothetical protein
MENKGVSIQKVQATDISLRTVLQKARVEPVVLQAEEEGEFAVLPLDDEVLDLLLERNPAFIAECRQILERMRQGEYVTYEEALEMFRHDSETAASHDGEVEPAHESPSHS